VPRLVGSCGILNLVLEQLNSLGYRVEPFALPVTIMNSIRVARAALRVRPTAFAAPLARRGYADVASDKIKLSLSLPHQVRPPPRFYTYWPAIAIYDLPELKSVY